MKCPTCGQRVEPPDPRNSYDYSSCKDCSMTMGMDCIGDFTEPGSKVCKDKIAQADTEARRFALTAGLVLVFIAIVLLLVPRTPSSGQKPMKVEVETPRSGHAMPDAGGWKPKILQPIAPPTRRGGP